jgi:peptidoglycan/LPS O-acetylase OafA/YrhL
MDKPRRYTTLEGMRGIGAVYVVLLHGEVLFGNAAPQSAYLGVDFFFVLSGFIVAHVYAKPLDNGLPVTAFLRSRLLRLYPVYLLGTLSGVALAIESSLIGHSDLLWNYQQPLVSLPFALALLPSPVTDAMFPLDIPAWSLFLEFVINIVFAVRYFRSTRSLLAIMAVSGLALVVALVTKDTLNFGWNKPTGLLGLARIAFSFPLGVFVYRLHGRLPAFELPGWFFLVPTLALTVLMYATPTGTARIVFDVAFILIISPALVLSGAASNPGPKWVGTAFITLGALSYPLYTLHYPTLMAVMGTIQRHVPKGAAALAAAIVMLFAMVVIAHYVAELDGRLRARLTRRRRRAAIAAATG